MANDDAGLSQDEHRDLGVVAGTMIPANAQLGMPGADDPTILADIAASVGRDLPLIRQALRTIAAKSEGALASLDRDRREAVFSAYYAEGGASAAALGRLVLSAYYRDDRVLLAVGHEARAPFPKGHVLEQGDWSLLDPVKAMAPSLRRAQ
jgi:hypothetical protein